MTNQNALIGHALLVANADSDSSDGGPTAFLNPDKDNNGLLRFQFVHIPLVSPERVKARRRISASFDCTRVRNPLGTILWMYHFLVPPQVFAKSKSSDTAVEGASEWLLVGLQMTIQ